MRLLITGGAGFIGSHLVERALGRGWRVRVLDNFSTGRRENLPAHPALEVITGDIRDAAAVDAAVTGCDAIAHLAAVASVQASVDNPRFTHETNFDGTLTLLQAARTHGARRFVFSSTAAVYGNPQQLPVSEDTPAAPLTPYGADKLASEHFIGFYRRQFGLETAIFRFFNIYGPRQDPASPYSGVISIFTQRVRAGQGVTLFGDGEQTRDFVYVGDVADLLCEALQRPTPPEGPVNLGRGEGTSLRELLAVIGHLAGQMPAVTHAPDRPGDIRHSRANNGRLLREYGARSFVPLRAGLRSLLEG